MKSLETTSVVEKNRSIPIAYTRINFQILLFDLKEQELTFEIFCTKRNLQNRKFLEKRERKKAAYYL